MKKIRILAAVMALIFLILPTGGFAENDVTRAYDEALNAMRHGSYAEAANLLGSISFHEDSAILMQYCRAWELAGKQDYQNAIAILEGLGSYRDSAQCAAYLSALRAEETAGTPYEMTSAAAMYDQREIRGFKDTMERAAKIRNDVYQKGLNAEKDMDWITAAACFDALGNYQDAVKRCHYAAGRYYEGTGEKKPTEYINAIREYDQIRYYLDSKKRRQECLEAAFASAEKMIGEGDFDGALAVYNSLGDLCDDEKKTALEEAREKARLEQAYEDAAMMEKKGMLEDAASAYLAIGEYLDSRDRHYQIGVSVTESSPEAAIRILKNDIEYRDTREVLYSIAESASGRADYPVSVSGWEALGTYRDCRMRMIHDLYLYGYSLLESGNPNRATEVFDSLGDIGAAEQYAVQARYAAAVRLEEDGKYEAAAAAFETVSDYSDSAARAVQCRYKQGKVKKDEGKYLEAAEIFAALVATEDSAKQEIECRYLQAGKYEQQRRWSEAIAIYQALGEYSDSKNRMAACYSGMGETLLAKGTNEVAYQAFVNAGDTEGQARAALAVADDYLSTLQMQDALIWYERAAALPETAEKTTLIAERLLNVDEDALSEAFASIAGSSEKSREVLYMLAIRSIERQDMDAAMRLMQKAGNSADAAERFSEMLNERVRALVSEEKYGEAADLCTFYGDEEQAGSLREQQAQAEAEKQRAAEEEKRQRIQAQIDEAEAMLNAGEYDTAAEILTQIGETERARDALDRKAAAEEAARKEAEEAERQKIQAQIDEAEAKMAEGDYDGAIGIYRALNNQPLMNEAIYRKAGATDQPELYLTIAEYRDSREQHYLAGKAKMETDPERAFRILTDDITYRDVSAVLYELADRESGKGNYILSSAIFETLRALPLDPENVLPDCLLREIQDLYQYGLTLQKNGDWQLAASIFDQLAEIGNAQQHSFESYYAIADELEKSGKYAQAAISFEAIKNYSNAADRAKNNRYEAAAQMFEQGAYEDAMYAFTKLGEYKDASKMVLECRYQSAVSKKQGGKYTEAYQMFTGLKDYSESKEQARECIYLIAEGYKEAGEYQRAIDEYAKLPEYRDTAEKIAACHEALGDAYQARAEELMRSGATQSAADAFEAAYGEYNLAGLMFKSIESALRIGECNEALNDLQAAIRWYMLAGTHGGERLSGIFRYMFLTEQYEDMEKLAMELGIDEGKEYLCRLAEKVLAEGDEETALRLYTEAADYSGAADRHDDILYQRAERLAEQKEYQAAADLFGSISGYKDAAEKQKESMYNLARSLEEEGLYTSAMIIYQELGDYADAKERGLEMTTKIIK